MKRYKKLIIAVLAIASVYVVRETGLDQGLIDNLMEAVAEAIVEPDQPVDTGRVGQ